MLLQMSAVVLFVDTPTENVHNVKHLLLMHRFQMRVIFMVVESGCISTNIEFTVPYEYMFLKCLASIYQLI